MDFLIVVATIISRTFTDISFKAAVHQDHLAQSPISISIQAKRVLYSRYFANPKWSFVGYQYRWSPNYSTAEEFNTQKDCVRWGNLWLGSQTSEEALFTCSPGCKTDKDSHGIDICEKVCEYNREGLIRCRD